LTARASFEYSGLGVKIAFGGAIPSPTWNTSENCSSLGAGNVTDIFGLSTIGNFEVDRNGSGHFFGFAINEIWTVHPLAYGMDCCFGQ